MANYKVTLIWTETIEVEDNMCILDGAEEAGMDLPYSCRAGSCLACVGKITAGSVNQDDQAFLDDRQLSAGYALLCVAYPTSDCTIELNKEEEIY